MRRENTACTLCYRGGCYSATPLFTQRLSGNQIHGSKRPSLLITPGRVKVGWIRGGFAITFIYTALLVFFQHRLPGPDRTSHNLLQKVEAMYEPEQLSAAGGSYDATALTSAAAAVMAADDGDDNTDARSCRAAAVDDITRAVRVAELLGLRLVGWCLSHDAVREWLVGLLTKCVFV